MADHILKGPTLVSSTLLSVGDTLTNMSVLAVPPREVKNKQLMNTQHACTQAAAYARWQIPSGPTLVSSTLLSVGDTLTNMSVLAVPPRESDMSIVSLWLRYGMCTASLASALITSPSADRLLLMACASLSCSPALLLFLILQVHDHISCRLKLHRTGKGS